MAQAAGSPTKAQRALLVHICARSKEGGGDPLTRLWSGGDLIDLYRERRGDEDWWAGSPRSHAWRRAGGRALKLLADAGYMSMVQFNWGVPQYTLTYDGWRIGHGDDLYDPRDDPRRA